MVDTSNGRTTGKEWLSRKEASIFLEEIGCPVSPRTLRSLAANDNAGRGPPFIRFRRKAVRYRRADLETWAKDEVKTIR